MIWKKQPIANQLATLNSKTAYNVMFVNNHIAVADANDGTDSIYKIFMVTNVDTLHTPYKDGLTSATDSIILNLNSNSVYNTQICFPISANGIFIRRNNPNGWSTWKAVALSS